MRGEGGIVLDVSQARFHLTKEALGIYLMTSVVLLSIACQSQATKAMLGTVLSLCPPVYYPERNPSWVQQK